MSNGLANFCCKSIVTYTHVHILTHTIFYVVSYLPWFLRMRVLQPLLMGIVRQRWTAARSWAGQSQEHTTSLAMVERILRVLSELRPPKAWMDGDTARPPRAREGAALHTVAKRTSSTGEKLCPQAVKFGSGGPAPWNSWVTYLHSDTGSPCSIHTMPY